MRRARTVTIALATVLALFPAAPAQADTTVVVHGWDYPGPDEYGYWDEAGWLSPVQRRCYDLTQPAELSNARHRFAYSDDTPPLGKRVNGFEFSGMFDTAIGLVGFTETPSTADVSIRVKADGGTTSGFLVAKYHPPYPATLTWYGFSPVTVDLTEANATGWTTVDGSGAEYEWRSYHNQRDPRWSAPEEDPATLADFVNSHGGDGTMQYDGIGFLGVALGCGSTNFHFDGLRVGPPGDVTTYDFEGLLAEKLTITASPGTVTAGQPVTLTGEPPVHMRQLTLQHRPYGASRFSDVGTAATYDETTGSRVPAVLRHRPKVRTEYRWVIPDSPSNDRSVSAVKVVTVRTAVSAALGQRTLLKGDTLVVKGATTPKKSGVATTLQRSVNGSWRTLATGRTSSKGTYRFAHRAGSKGKWKVRVLVAQAGGNLRGVSPARTATVL